MGTALATANLNSGDVSVLLGMGDGTFGAKTDFAAGANPYSVAVGDFNGDDDPDLAVANDSSNTVSVLLGGAGGAFGAKTDFATDTGPFSVAVGDFNVDGDPDLAVANQHSDTVSVLLGMGDGTFGAKTDFATGANPYSVAVGDFNGDDDPDLAVANANSDTVSVLLGMGEGTFGAKTDFATGTSPRSVAVGDFNGDDDPDLAVAHAVPGGVSVLLGMGDGTFGTKTDFATGTGAGPWSVAVGDFNGDNDPDLAVANHYADTVSVLLGGSEGTFGTKTDSSAGDGPVSVAVGDFNGDNDPDVAVANLFSSDVSLLLGRPAVGGVSSTKVDGSYTVGEVISVEVTFTEPVTVTGAPQLALETGTTDAVADYASGSGTDTLTFSYTVAAGHTTPDLDYTDTGALALAGGTIRDAAANDVTLTLPTPGAPGSLGANKNIVIDTTAPQTTIDSGPSGATNDPTPTFTFSSDEASSPFACRLDAGPWAACTSPHATTSLADGSHTIAVRATDTAGNTDPTPATRTFTVDTTAPQTTITIHPTKSTFLRKAKFAFKSSQPGSRFQCKMDRKPWKTCTSPYVVNVEPGTHRFQVRAIDAAGNVDPTPAAWTWKVKQRS